MTKVICNIKLIMWQSFICYSSIVRQKGLLVRIKAFVTEKITIDFIHQRYFYLGVKLSCKHSEILNSLKSFLWNFKRIYLILWIFQCKKFNLCQNLIRKKPPKIRQTLTHNRHFSTTSTPQVLTSFFLLSFKKNLSLYFKNFNFVYNTKNKQIANNEYFVNQQKVDG